MKTPRLNRRLVLETRGETPNGSGGFAISWTGLGTVWAAVLPGTGREGGAEAVTLGQVSCRIVLRAAPDGAESRPRPGQRLREGGRVFGILAVTEADPDARYLTCFAREEVPA